VRGQSLETGNNIHSSSAKKPNLMTTGGNAAASSLTGEKSKINKYVVNREV
jgi:hypothetical protein